MTNHKIFLSSSIILSLSLSGCSNIGQQNNSNIAVNETLIIPPSLKGSVAASSPSIKTNQKRPRTNVSNKNYYVVVGTYSSQPQAFETFVRLSSIGLPGATMESRKAKSGNLLHMVRLGPYQKQESIDEVTNSLTSDGLTQFKVVEN